MESNAHISSPTPTTEAGDKYGKPNQWKPPLWRGLEGQLLNSYALDEHYGHNIAHFH